MTRAEFIAHTSNLGLRLRPLVRWCLWVLVPLSIPALAEQLWYRHFLGTHPSVLHRGSPFHTALWELLTLPGFLPLDGYVVLVLGTVLWGWRIMAVTAPRCIQCHHLLAGRHYPVVLSSGQCPFCRHQLFPATSPPA